MSINIQTQLSIFHDGILFLSWNLFLRLKFLFDIDFSQSIVDFSAAKLEWRCRITHPIYIRFRSLNSI